VNFIIIASFIVLTGILKRCQEERLGKIGLLYESGLYQRKRAPSLEALFHMIC